jgi:hypothetical protein
MFIEKQKTDWSFWRGALAGSVFMSLTLAALGKLTQTPNPVSTVDMPKDIIQAYNMGLKDALRINPPSMDLEIVCTGLWANKQPMK